MTNTKRYIADAMTAMLNNDTDRAIGLLMRASLAYDDDISKVAEPYERAAQQRLDEKKLPPMEKVPGTKLKTRDVKCPTCKSKGGDPCKRLTSRGPHGKPTDVDLVTSEGKPFYHGARTKRAKELSD